MSKLTGDGKRLPKALKSDMLYLFALKTGGKNFQNDLTTLMKNWTPYPLFCPEWEKFYHKPCRCELGPPVKSLEEDAD